jgi:hypothetical protein
MRRARLIGIGGQDIGTRLARRKAGAAKFRRDPFGTEALDRGVHKQGRSLACC